jgi:hypothetical protein
MDVYIGYTIWKHTGEPRMAYVAQVPGDGGKDWGYTFVRTQAVPLSLYWRRRFERDMARCNQVGSFAPI